MNNIREITAKFEIVTPMFLGGADRKATRIRESSIKGALAFWWRALNYARFVAEVAKPDSEKPEKRCGKSALALMQIDEQKLFGGPKGQGAFLLRVVQGEDLATSETTDSLTENAGVKYLGYGILDGDRSYIKPGQGFSVQILFRQSNQSDVVNEIVPALKLFGLLGGLGSRVRRGWGSVALTSLQAEGIDAFEDWVPLKTADDYSKQIDDYSKQIKGLFNKHPSQTTSGTDWSLTAFAKETDIIISIISTKSDHKYLTVLNVLGDELKKYRKTNKTKGELKHRASPLMFHIHKTPDKNYFGVGLYFPTIYCLSKDCNDNLAGFLKDFPANKLEWTVVKQEGSS